jgi:phage RecT family recombinase
MTAPARTQQQPAATPLVDMGLLDKIIEQTISTRDAHKRLAPFLSVGQSYDRIAAQVREAIIKTPKLADCDPTTIIDAVVTIQRWRLEIGETAYLVPFRSKGRDVCTAVRGYIGDIELLINNGLARRVDAFCVYKNEPFTYREGTSPLLEHMPLPPSQRGEMIGAYAILWQTFSNSKAAFLYVEEIEEIREKFSKQWKREIVGALPTWYAKKCAVKAVTKLLPKSPKLSKLREQMDEDEIVVASVERGISTTRPPHVTADGEDLSEGDDRLDPTMESGPSHSRHTGQSESAPTSSANTSTDSPECPKCGGAMWDNRIGKTNPKAPDFKCRDKSCDGVIWPPRDAKPKAPPSALNTQGEIPGMDDGGRTPPNALAHP